MPDAYEGSDPEQFFKLAEQFGLTDILPEWEISVIENGDPDTWEHYHPRAPTEEAAKKAALDTASGLGSEFNDPVVYEVLYGPYADGVGKNTVVQVLDSLND